MAKRASADGDDGAEPIGFACPLCGSATDWRVCKTVRRPMLVERYRRCQRVVNGVECLGVMKTRERPTNPDRAIRGSREATSARILRGVFENINSGALTADK